MIRFIVSFVFLCAAAFTAFGQTAALRDYVGMISQVFHPDVVAYMQDLKKDYEKAGEKDIVRGIDNYLKGESGTGWVYVARDGKNYILTNYHVISQADSLSITFEKPNADGNVEKTKFSDLTIIAADEDMDIALLAFAGGQNPFKQGFSLLTRAVQDGDTVYSAGYPTLGGIMMSWQFGQGIVSNASIRLPSEEEDETDKTIGPYIQHTAQIDPGNSGGPLLVQTAGVTTGYAVAGINTMTALRRQATNFSIPASRVQAFIDASLRPPTTDQKPLLEARVNSFVDGLKVPKAVYPHIAKYISNTCVGENADFAISEAWEKAPLSVRRRIFYNRSPVSVMTYAVAWTIENNIRDKKSGRISIETGNIEPGANNTFTVSFIINSVTIDSVWKNEYGIWRINSIGEFASGDKTLKQKKQKAKADSERLHSEPFFQIGTNVGLFTNEQDPAFGLTLGFRMSKYTGFGMQGFFGKEFSQIQVTFDIYVPITAGTVAFTPFVKGAAGIMPLNMDVYVFPFTFVVSAQGGLQFTTAAVPGLYLQAAYQHSFYTLEKASVSLRDSSEEQINSGMIYIGIGYSF